MLKKALFSLVFAVTTASTAFGMQLTTVQTATKAAKQAYQKCVIQLKKIELKNTDLYAKVEPILAKIIASEEFKTKMTAAIDEQYTAIVDQNTPFTAIKQETSLTDFLPGATSMNNYTQKLYTIMANKANCQLLWQKLFGKEKELTAEFEKLEQELTAPAA